MKSFVIELAEQTVEGIRECFQFKNDADVAKQLQYWVDLGIDEAILKSIIRDLEGE